MALSRRSMPGGRPGRDVLGLVVLWVVMTAPFLEKAFHIDDTVHVLQAQHVAANPTRPLEQEIFWFEWPEWLADSNPITPPVWQYELAAVIAVAGGVGEVAFNTLSSLHLLLLTLAVYQLGRHFLRRPVLAAAFVLAGPAAVVGRNVMLDVPALSYLAAGLAAVVTGTERDRPGLTALGALLVGIAAVTKLPGVVGVPVVLGYLVLGRRWRALPVVLLAVLPLGLWYAYQLAATGGIDILRPRGGGGFSPEHSLATSLAVALGHLSFWGGAVFTGHAFLLASLVVRPRLAVGLLGLAAAAAAAYGTLEDGIGANPLLTVGFFGGGLALLWGAAAGARGSWALGERERRLAALLVLWAVGHVAFAVAGGWEMNIRFAFLSAVPATLLCVAALDGESPRRPSAPPSVSVATLGVGAVVSLLVGWADAQWADGYRRLVPEVRAAYRPGPGGRMFFVGHWGFQHYAVAAGMTAYSPRDHRLAPGDLLVIPITAARQTIPDGVMERLTVLERRSIVPRLPLRTMSGGGGFYSTGWGPLPWGWSREPAEVIMVTRYE
jgi:hypothetical protein